MRRMSNWVTWLLLIGALHAVASVAAAQEPKRTPLSEYRSASALALFKCKLSYRLSAYNAELGVPQDESSDVYGCIEKGRAETRAALDKALRTLKKPAAREALKSYHVAVSSALQGIVPVMQERVMHYSERQSTLQAKLDEAWARFEIEQ